MKRRDFVAGAAGTGAALSLFPAGLAGLERETPASGLERRALGHLLFIFVFLLIRYLLDFFSEIRAKVIFIL